MADFHGGSAHWADCGLADFTATWSTADDPRSRAFPLRRLLVPWAQAQAKTPALTSTQDREIPELQGGNWPRGKKLFYGKATCGACHRAAGQGGLAGPDLSNLVHRDYASVVRDIREPNAALNPDRLGYVVEPREGSAFTAVLVGGDDQHAQFADTTGVKTTHAQCDPHDDCVAHLFHAAGFARCALWRGATGPADLSAHQL